MSRPVFDLAVSFVTVAVSTLLLFEAMAIKAPANVFPAMILGLVAVLALVAFARTLRRLLLSSAADHLLSREALPGLLVTAALFVGYIAMMTTSYVAATFIFLLVLYLYLAGDFSLRSILLRTVTAATVTAAVYACFVLWLGVNLGR